MRSRLRAIFPFVLVLVFFLAGEFTEPLDLHHQRVSIRIPDMMVVPEVNAEPLARELQNYRWSYLLGGSVHVLFGFQH